MRQIVRGRLRSRKDHNLSDEKTFSGRVAIVTGATRGIGRAIALELGRRGADVAFNYAKSAESAETLKAELEAFGVRVLSSQCNVGNTEAAAEMASDKATVVFPSPGMLEVSWITLGGRSTSVI